MVESEGGAGDQGAGNNEVYAGSNVVSEFTIADA